MRENLNLLFKNHLPGLRLKALQVAKDAAHAERLVHSVYQHSMHHATELVTHPNPRSWLFQVMARLLEPQESLAA